LQNFNTEIALHPINRFRNLAIVNLRNLRDQREKKPRKHKLICEIRDIREIFFCKLPI